MCRGENQLLLKISSCVPSVIRFTTYMTILDTSHKESREYHCKSISITNKSSKHVDAVSMAGRSRLRSYSEVLAGKQDVNTSVVPQSPSYIHQSTTQMTQTEMSLTSMPDHFTGFSYILLLLNLFQSFYQTIDGMHTNIRINICRCRSIFYCGNTFLNFSIRRTCNLYKSY